MTDGSKKFRLVGGKHDGAGKKKAKGGFWLRLYPDVRAEGYWVDKSFVATTPAVWPAELEYDGEVYAIPDDGNEARFVRKATSACS